MISPEQIKSGKEYSLGAKLLYVLSEATVPRVTLSLFGGGADVMNSKHIGADMNFVSSTAEIAVMEQKRCSVIIFKKGN
jgi:propionyl-CoA carboxylase beta chain